MTRSNQPSLIESTSLRFTLGMLSRRTSRSKGPGLKRTGTEAKVTLA